jgi:ribosome-associated toxin RatA of RatAB toxin-antitoxin module
MAVSDSREVVVNASPEQILDVIADVEATPTWAPQYKKAEILDTYEDGRPKRVKMQINSAGITDDLVVEYTWTDHSATWNLLSAKALKSQVGKYTVTPNGDTTTLRFDIEIDLLIPLPGFLLKRAMKGAVDVATDGLKKQVHKVIAG